jgi:hypothetical protein
VGPRAAAVRGLLMGNADAICSLGKFLGHQSSKPIAPPHEHPSRTIVQVLRHARNDVGPRRAQCADDATDCRGPATGGGKRPWPIPRSCARRVQGEKVRAASAMERHFGAGVEPDRTAVQDELSGSAASSVSRSPSLTQRHSI